MSFEYNPRTGNPRRILRRRLGLQLFARRHDQQLTLPVRRPPYRP